ncbi:bitter taste receptor Modo-T2R25 [Monodelphis domestica]|uniref:Taste receptor type 2 n=1 Tax=Monodelphis domestica TaxID=13616 RepID=Q2AB94_MONDO|nr:bitter taste receptor Modo-T2R25 [Monodelphis domestica]BAE80373.1 bitter taste receptor [Monodelphis domestica]
MPSGGDNILLVLVVGQFLMGILGNGFMILVNGIDWIKSKKLATGDIILVSLAISRIGMLSTLTCVSFQLVFNPDELLNEGINVSEVFWILTYLSSIWFATCLSVFYFLKIANFSHSLFLWLKWRINQLVGVLMVGPWLFSMTINLPMLERAYNNALIRRNNTKVYRDYQVNESEYITIQIVTNLSSLIPLFLSLVSFLLLVFSLRRHMHQMKHSATGSRDPSMEAHVRAIKAILSFLIFVVLFFLGSFIILWNFSIPGKDSNLRCGIPLMCLCPSGHTLILILHNSKLRQAALKVWWQVRDCLKGSK